jgi:Ca2+-transporting ATPase
LQQQQQQQQTDSSGLISIEHAMEGSASDEATGTPPGSGIARRQRAPTITVDTSAVNPPLQPEGLALQDLSTDHRRTPSAESAPYRAVNTPRHSRNTSSTDGLDSRPISPHNVSSPVSRTNEHNYLAVPDSRSRRNSAGSEDVSPTQVSFGGETAIATSNPSPAVDGVLANGDQKKEHNVFDPITTDESVLQPDPGTEKSFDIPDNKFAFSPGVLGKLYNPKSLAAFYALGGLAGMEMGLRTNIRAGLSMDETTFPDSVTFDDVKDYVRASQESPDSSKDATLKPSTSDLAASKSTSPDHFADRRRVFAENRLPVKKTKNIFQLAWIAYNDKVLILLSIAAVISLALGLYQTFGQPHPPGQPPVEWIEGVAIMAAIIIVVVVGAGNDWQKERQFAKLNRKKEDRTVKVIRSGHSQEINVHDLLVGDVMHLEPGDLVPVDGILIEGSGVKCDESSATGESDIIKKQPAPVVYRAIEARQDTRKLDPFILSGSKVNEGMGTFLVTAVGVNSVYGKTLVSLHDEIEATPLQLKLNRLAEGIAKLGGASALLLFIVLFIKFLVSLPGSTETPSKKGQNFLQILIVSITVVVVAVPEGLPLAVTLALAFATMRMLRDNNLVRALQACETMGNATTVCSDKTGTLTQNKMTVVAGTIGASSSFGDKDLVSRTKTSESSAKVAESALDQDAGNVTPQALVGTLAPSVKEVLRASIALNSTAFEGEQDGKPTFIGSKTETALLSFARDYLGMDTVRVERSNARIVQSVPFDSGRKCMATIVQLSDGTFRMYVKGASEIMLAKCTGIVPHPTKGLDVVSLTDETERALNVMIDAYASHSLRTIGLIYRDFQTWPPEGARSADDPQMADFDAVFQRMTFLSVVGIQDPLRDGVRDAVRKCQMAGVFVRMVTGDNVVTARAIAEECGIFTPGGVIMEGPKFRRLNRAQMDRTIPRLQVLARSSPEDKRILVKRLKELGETVAVTGDGTNDAPALRTADVGFSMGIAGTEVAKEASSIILMDDNFASIVKAIMWGRAVNDAVKKFLQVGYCSCYHCVDWESACLTFLTLPVPIDG